MASICQSDKAKLSNVITACTALIESEAVPTEQLVTYLKERGWAYYSSRQYESAIADETHVLVLQPGNTESMLARAKNYEALDDLDAAAAEYRRALLISPDDLQILFKQAKLFSKQGEELAASNGYRRALELDPGLAKAAWRYANSLFELDGPSATETFLSEARRS